MSIHSSRVFDAIRDALTPLLDGVAEVHEEEQRPIEIDTACVILRRGEAELVETLLSPLAYSYDHALGLEIIAPTRPEVDRVLILIGQWITTDRSLSGLCDWLEGGTPKTDVAEAFGTENYPYALVDLVASYTIPSPLS